MLVTLNNNMTKSQIELRVATYRRDQHHVLSFSFIPVIKTSLPSTALRSAFVRAALGFGLQAFFPYVQANPFIDFLLSY